MDKKLLVIEGGHHTTLLLEALTAMGWDYLLVRGPLRLSEWLKGGTLRLVLWVEDDTNRALGADLAQVWGRFPQVAVVHVFAQGGPAPVGVDSPQVVASLPVHVSQSQLGETLERWLGGLMAAVPPKPEPELAIRHLLLRWVGRGKWPDRLRVRDTGGDIPRNMSLQPEERQALFSRPLLMPRRWWSALWPIRKY